VLSLNWRTETEPSEEAHANMQPASCGDQEMRFTEAVWRAKSKTFVLLGFSVRYLVVGTGVRN